MKRPIQFSGDVACITLTKGYMAVIDAADAHLVDGRNWIAHEVRRKDGTVLSVYAYSMNPGPRKNRKLSHMHRVIMETPDGLQVDHIDGDGLNNRRNNLRNVTRAQNACNRRIAVNNTSGANGVTWDKAGAMWVAQIMVAKRNIYLGRYASVAEAKAAYDAAAQKYFGEFRRVG